MVVQANSAKVVLVNVSDLLANPYRKIDEYPIDEKKVEELIESFKATGVWPNIQGRPAPGKKGKYEIAFGHHRREAMKRARVKQVYILVEKLSNEQMLKRMAHENSEEWASNSSIDMETISSVVEAYAAGDIDLSEYLPSKSGSADWLIAPSVTKRGEKSGVDELLIYTRLMVARFLGWTRKKTGTTVEPTSRFQVAWRSLELMEDPDSGVTRSTFRGLSRQQAREVNKEASKTLADYRRSQRLAEKAAKHQEQLAKQAASDKQRRYHESKADKQRKAASEVAKEGRKQAGTVAKALAKGMKEGGVGVRDAASVASGVRKPAPKPDVPPNVSTIMGRLTNKCVGFINGKDARDAQEMDAVIKFRKEGSETSRERLVDALLTTADRLIRYAVRLKAEPTQQTAIKLLTKYRD